MWPRGLVAMPAAKVFDAVLQHAGARPKDRDDIDRRIVAEVRDRKGRIFNSHEDAGGYPKPAMTRRRLIVPAEDLDEWLENSPPKSNRLRRKFSYGGRIPDSEYRIPCTYFWAAWS